MKAVICTKYGPPEVLQIEERERPIPRDNEILIRVHATTAHIGDTKLRRLAPGLGPVEDFFFKPIMRIMLGFSGPRRKVLGMDLSGTVESVGSRVTRFAPGDEVFGATGLRFGAYAEYCCLGDDAVLAKKPSNLSHAEAAPISNGGPTALLSLQKVNIKNGHRILIYGASGSVGTYAVQLAKYFGADVTGVCSTSNIVMVKSIGADKVIDYTREDFTESGDYDIILDVVGKVPRRKQRSALADSGIYFNLISLSNNFKLKSEDLEFLAKLCEEGHFKSVIDRTYPLDEIVAAHSYVDLGHKKGNVAIKVVDTEVV